MRRFLAVLFVSLLPSTALAGGFTLSTGVGVTKFFDDGPTGFGLEVFPGFDVWNGLIVEGQFGVHSGRQDFGIVGNYLLDSPKFTTSVFPFEAGVRFARAIGPVTPFAAAHAGAVVLRGCANSNCDSDAEFGINFGGGANYDITPQVGVGLAMWFHEIFTEHDGLELFHFGLHATFSL